MLERRLYPKTNEVGECRKVDKSYGASRAHDSTAVEIVGRVRSAAFLVAAAQFIDNPLEGLDTRLALTGRLVFCLNGAQT